MSHENQSKYLKTEIKMCGVGLDGDHAVNLLLSFHVFEVKASLTGGLGDDLAS